MLLKPVPLEIDSAEPFKHDALKRKGQAEMLTKVFGDLKIPFVLAVDSSFGTGKTTFIGMWRRHLEKEGYQTIHFNAWENDFTENALISLIGELRQAINTEGKKSQNVIKAGIKMTTALPRAIY